MLEEDSIGEFNGSLSNIANEMSIFGEKLSAREKDLHIITKEVRVQGDDDQRSKRRDNHEA